MYSPILSSSPFGEMTSVLSAAATAFSPLTPSRSPPRPRALAGIDEVAAKLDECAAPWMLAALGTIIAAGMKPGGAVGDKKEGGLLQYRAVRKRNLFRCRGSGGRRGGRGCVGDGTKGRWVVYTTKYKFTRELFHWSFITHANASKQRLVGKRLTSTSSAARPNLASAGARKREGFDRSWRLPS